MHAVQMTVTILQMNEDGISGMGLRTEDDAPGMGLYISDKRLIPDDIKVGTKVVLEIQKVLA